MKHHRSLGRPMKWGIVVVVAALYPLGLLLLYPLMGEAAAITYTIAPVVATLMLNLRVGIAVILVNAVGTGVFFSHVSEMNAEVGLPRAFLSVAITATICIGADFLRRYIEQRKIMASELHQAKKMEAIGRLAGGVAHDVNNTLNAIMGSAFALRHELAPYGKSFRDLDNIAAACDRGGQLTRNLLGFARNSEYEREVFSLNAVAESIQSLLDRTASKTIDIKTVLSKETPGIIGDRGQIENAVINLCLNALDAMGDRGTLILITKVEKEHCSICVADTGPGMDEGVRERVFEPFFTTKSAGKGTGLGLSMVYGAVQSMGGRISVDSAPGEGTRMTLSFPLAPEEERVTIRFGSDPGTDGLAFLRGKTVLIIDDEPLVLRSSVRMLRTLGCEVLSANTGQQGVALYREHQGEVALSIVDLIMPDMDGSATVEEIIKIEAHAPVLLASGYARGGAEAVKAKVQQHATVGFLEKPYQPAQLVDAARKITRPRLVADNSSNKDEKDTQKERVSSV